MASDSGPVETKVTVATTAAVVTAAVLWALDTYVFTGNAVPAPVEGLIQLIVLGAVTFGAGWSAKHTVRPVDPILPVSPTRPLDSGN